MKKLKSRSDSETTVIFHDGFIKIKENITNDVWLDPVEALDLLNFLKSIEHLIKEQL